MASSTDHYSDDTGHVYTLIDPRTGEVKYVGASKSPHQRLYTHNKGMSNDDVSEWIEELHTHGLSPEMEIVDTSNLENLGRVEANHIKRISEDNDLLNRRENSGYPISRKPKTETKRVTVPPTVHEEAKKLAKKYDSSIKESIRRMCREAGYDV